MSAEQITQDFEDFDGEVAVGAQLHYQFETEEAVPELLHHVGTLRDAFERLGINIEWDIEIHDIGSGQLSLYCWRKDRNKDTNAGLCAVDVKAVTDLLSKLETVDIAGNRIEYYTLLDETCMDEVEDEEVNIRVHYEAWDEDQVVGVSFLCNYDVDKDDPSFNLAQCAQNLSVEIREFTSEDWKVGLLPVGNDMIHIEFINHKEGPDEPSPASLEEILEFHKCITTLTTRERTISFDTMVTNDGGDGGFNGGYDDDDDDDDDLTGGGGGAVATATRTISRSASSTSKTNSVASSA